MNSFADSELKLSQHLSAEQSNSVRTIAFFLTQFHPTPENDEWWGKGFTEWTNATKALPLFDGHYQPHLPTDLGFYDLRLRETRRDQIAIAKKFGIDGFCYHYYWFSGRRVLNQPLDDMLVDPGSDMPFCLCWANENWTRKWDAADKEVLIAQKYLPDDDLNFIESLIPFFNDPRYIRIDGAPLLIVYRPTHLTNARKTIAVWREFCESIGIRKIYLCAALTHGNDDYSQWGFDGGVEFPPHNLRDANINSSINFHSAFQGNVMEYQTVAKSFIERTYLAKNVFRTVFPSWDNTARTGDRAVIVWNGTPANYEYWLAESIRRTVQDFPRQERLVFINAWNEWAEGCHLEPDRRHGRQFLEATLRVKQGQSFLEDFTDVSLPQAPQPENERNLVSDLRKVARYHFSQLLGRAKLVANRMPLLKSALLYVLRVITR